MNATDRKVGQKKEGVLLSPGMASSSLLCFLYRIAVSHIASVIGNRIGYDHGIVDELHGIRNRFGRRMDGRWVFFTGIPASVVTGLQRQE